MCNFRLSVRHAFRLIFLCAIALGVAVHGIRLHGLSEHYRKKSLMYHAIAKLEMQNLATSRAAENDPDPEFRASYSHIFRKAAADCIARAEYFTLMEKKYARASVCVWEAVAPDPPEPPFEPLVMPIRRTELNDTGTGSVKPDGK
jgi:hypothetical protein